MTSRPAPRTTALLAACRLHKGAAALNRRLFGRLLLSLALLLSQQAAISHTVAHQLRLSRTAAAGSAKQSGSAAKDGSCADCLAHAQFFAALGSAHLAPAVVRPAPLRLALPATPDVCLVTECMFQSRAPPPA